MPTKKIGERITNLYRLQVEDGVFYDQDGVPVPVGLGRGVKPDAVNANPSATANTYGTEATLFNGFNLIPQSVTVTFGGTFGVSETITTTLTATYSDGTTGTLDVTATSTGTQRVTYGGTNNLENLVKNGVYITKLTAKSKSTINDSLVTVSVQVVGFGQ